MRGGGLTIIKHPGERSLKSYCNLLVVKSENYYLDRLTADVHEGNMIYDVFNYISYVNYNAIFIFKKFLSMKKFYRVVFQSMRWGAVHHNGAQCCMHDFDFFSHYSTPSKNITKIYVMKDILNNADVKYRCGRSRK